MGDLRERRSSASSHGSQDSHENAAEQAIIGHSSILFTRPPLEDRSKYEKLQNAHDESEEEGGNTAVLEVRECLKQPISQIQVRKVLESHHRKRRKEKTRKGHSSKQKESAEGGKADGVFICSVSDDDSIGSASDLKARINDEYDYDNCDRGDISETISSSVYHAECESVTTHEEDPRAEGCDPSHLVRRGPKPSRAAMRARARALQEQENKKCPPDRLLGHEYGEKPLLQDDELDSGEEEVKLSEDEIEQQCENQPVQQQDQVPLRTSIFHVPRPFRKTSMDESYKQKEYQVDEDVFAQAPFKTSLKKINKKVFHSRSQPSSNTVSPLEMSNQAMITPPISNTSPAHVQMSIPEVLDQVVEPHRLPVQADVIYEESPSEEYPIYENVVINPGNSTSENGVITPRYHHYENIPGPYTASAYDTSAIVNPVPTMNPFVNPFVKDDHDQLSAETTVPVLQSSSSIVPADAQEQDASINLENITQKVNQVLMTHSIDSLTPTSVIGSVNSPSFHSTDLFGSTPFYDMTMSSATPVDAKEFSSPNQSTVNGNVTQFSHHAQSVYFTPPSDVNSHVPLHASTPRSLKVKQVSASRELYSTEIDDADLFGAVPFKPVIGNQHRSCQSSGGKSQTLPANMNSVFQAQMAQMAKEDGYVDKFLGDFKTSKSLRKSTPPSFRKPRTTHQKLSDSDTSSDDGVVIAPRKPKHRDRSKDRLKYKNISEEFEEENMMVLPVKQFGHLKKEKISKKNKKLEKIDKKVDKAEKKPPEKNTSFEAAGISNMSFEDYSLEESRRESERNCRDLDKSRQEVDKVEDSLQSPEEDDSDLRMTGGTRFGSLKRGINPFSKLGR